MNRPFTIYFDTNFYIWLSQAPHKEADNVISNLNQLQVRYVLSGKILFELLSGRERNYRDKNLVKRVKKLKIAPYITPLNSLGYNIDLSWDILLLQGELRNAISELLKAIYDVETVAQSWSVMANRRLPKDKEKKLQEILQPFLFSIQSKQIQNKEESTNNFANFVSELISSFSFILPNEQRKKLEEIDFTIEESPENLLNLSNQLLQSLDSETVKILEEEKKIINSSVELDPRPYNVAINNASKKEIKNLGNTFRDAGHINLFVAHQDQIDLIQIDSHQMNLVERNKPKHRLSQLDISSHCFSVGNLSQLIETVRNKKQEIYQ